MRLPQAIDEISNILECGPSLLFLSIGSKFGPGNDDSMAPLLPHPAQRAKLDNNFGKRCHSLDNELSRISSGGRTGGVLKRSAQDRLNLNNNSTQRDRESIV